MYVIFGATGGIGSDLAKRLLAANSTVILAADQEDKLSKLKEELGGGETKTVDVLNSKQVCGLKSPCYCCSNAIVPCSTGGYDCNQQQLLLHDHT